MSKPKVRCAIYTRKSHEEGLDQDFNSLDAQRSAAEAYIQSQVHEGWTILPARYDDGGFSGGTMERPALSQLLSDIRSGRVDCVVVYKVDRLSRSLLDFAKLIALFDEHKVSFCSVTQAFSTANSTGRLTLNLLLSFAQFEREIIGDRIRDKKLLTARQGKFIGGQPKLGLDVVDRRYVVNSEEAKLVRRIFQMAADGQSCRSIAVALNAEGARRKSYTTKTGKRFGGETWRGRNVYDVLTDKKYIGKIEHKGTVYRAKHNAIVSEELFEQVQRVLAENRVYTHPHQAKRFALLRRLLRCGECGSAVQPAWTRNHGREYRYYTCSKRIKTGYQQCCLPSIPADELERLVVDQLRGLFRHPEVIARTFREVAAQTQRGPEPGTLARLDELRARRNQVTGAIRSLLTLNDPESEFIHSELQDLNDQLKSLDSSIRDIESAPKGDVNLDQVASALKKLDPIWELLHPNEKRRVLELLIEGVEVSRECVTVRLIADGIEQIVTELEPVGDRDGRTKAKPKLPRTRRIPRGESDCTSHSGSVPTA